MFEQKKSYDINDLIGIMRLLRGRGDPENSGCPWDIEQTHVSIRSNVIEEAYEVAEAIDSGSVGALREELGDLLLQVVFHAQIACESDTFSFGDICDGICKKLIYRHPHVFGDVVANTSAEVLKNWDDLKSGSKGEKTAADRLDAVTKLLPALTRGEKVGKRAANTGFDFPDTKEVIKTLKSEIQELEDAISHKNDVEIEEEFGDVLFTCCNLGRFLKKDSEKALTISINRFIMRFRELERMAVQSGESIDKLGDDKLGELWEIAKANCSH